MVMAKTKYILVRTRQIAT